MRGHSMCSCLVETVTDAIHGKEATALATRSAHPLAIVRLIYTYLKHTLGDIRKHLSQHRAHYVEHDARRQRTRGA